jgi:hypothetical protein
MTITLLAHHIEWDTDGDMDIAQSLPSKVAVEVDLLEGPEAGSINDQVCNQLSDLVGFCVLDYKLEGYSAEADYALQMTLAKTQSQEQQGDTMEKQSQNKTNTKDVRACEVWVEYADGTTHTYDVFLDIDASIEDQVYCSFECPAFNNPITNFKWRELGI